MFHVDQSAFLPEKHLIVFCYCFLDVSLDKKPLVNSSHFLNHSRYIEGRSQSHQSSNVRQRLRPEEVPEQVVAPETCPHHVDRRIRVSGSDDLKSVLQVGVSHPREGNRTGHLAVDSPAI